MAEATTPAERFEWTPERIAMVKRIALDHGTARAAAEAVGLDPEQDHMVYRRARSEGFRFTNIGRKRDDNALFIRLDDKAAAELSAIALERTVPRRDLATQVLSAVLDAGPTVVDNLLNEEA